MATTTEENVRELDTSGYTVLKSCVDVKCMEEVREQLLVEYESACPLPWRGGGKWFGHVNYVPAVSCPIIQEVASNKKIQEVLDRALGQNYKIIGLGGNANLPGSSYQPAHMDGVQGTDFLVINIPLGKVTEQNGSLEVWPGTHKEHLTVSQFNSAPRQSARVNSSPGDIVIRYSNVWHRGTPNRSSEVRFMLGILVSLHYGKLPAFPVSEDDQSIVSSFRLPAHFRTGPPIKGFAPNYFSTSPKGNLQELIWVYAPPFVFTAIQRFKRSGL
jgi:ectoine hydroxylase-related dioxygenase (phytanoyl-CoA dioxygenase family)